MTNIAALIRVTDYERLVGFQSHCEELQKELKLLSEVLICIHFSRPDHPLTHSVLDGLRKIILHPYTLRVVRVNPLLANWLLNAVALLQNYYDLNRERDFALELVNRFGLHTLDAPIYRLEENRYLFALLKGEKYSPTIDQTFERNFCRLSRDQVYALTHLLFYVSDYGTSQYSCSPERQFALEHLIYDAYRAGDIDLMLELLIVYQACEQSDEQQLTLFDKLLMKLIVKSSKLHHAMTEIDSEHFRTYYHQCLLALMYIHVRVRWSAQSNQLNLPAYRALRSAHQFHASLCSANYVKAARKFTSLVGLDSARLEFCRNNLEHYLALERHQLDKGHGPQIGEDS